MNPQIQKRPILFKGDMVAAILEGRKTQTRRLFKYKDAEKLLRVFEGGLSSWICYTEGQGRKEIINCPYGMVGDLLWVKETFAEIRCIGWDLEKFEYAYRADFAHNNGQWEGYADMCFEKWKPSIFMPRFASRISLRITDIRVERLHDITEEDAMAEGINCLFSLDAIDKYQQLWERINGEGSWGSNPWVWVIDFEPVA